MSVRWAELLDEARTRLDGVECVESPDADARRIVEQAKGSPVGYVTGECEEPVTARAIAYFDRMLARRCAGEPLQYVLGSWGFRSLDLMVDQRVLIPRPETEVVAGWAITEASERSFRSRREVSVVDLGTGSGAIALAVAAECPKARVYATDLSEDALAVARANLAGAGRAAARVSLHEGDWYEALPASLRGSVDVIVCNPPYVGRDERLPAVVADWEPSLALWAGDDGNEAFDTVIADAARWLRSDGALVMEIHSERGARVLHRTRAAGFSARLERDLAGLDRVLIARRP